MTEVTFRWHDEVGLDQPRLAELLHELGDLYHEPLRQRADLAAYPGKLMKHAHIAPAMTDGRVVGFLAIYANDKVTGVAHRPLLAVLPAHQGRGPTRALAMQAIWRAASRGMRLIHLEAMD